MIKVAGHDECNQLCTESNNKGIYNTRVISPPLRLPFEISKLLSFSVYYLHSVWVTIEGTGYSIGSNRDFRICGSISNEIYRKAIKIEIRDGEGNPRKLLSAVCGLYYTLYMVQPPVSGGSPELAYVYHEKNNGNPLFLNINGRRPSCLFGGEEYSAAIDSDGYVIIVTNNGVQILNLPNGYKAVSTAFCEQSVFALSQCNRLFESTYSKSKNKFSKFYEVSEFRKIEVIQIAGTFEHCLAVCADGSVFGRGSNDYGKLGLGNKIDKVEKFTRISALKNVNVRSVYAGSGHSLFQTFDGKVLACGKNNNGELMLDCGPSKVDCFTPAVSSINEKVSFCIAGSGLSVVFIGDELPPLIPNLRADDKRRMKRQTTLAPQPSHEPTKTPAIKHHKESDTSSSSEPKIKDAKKDVKKDPVGKIDDLKRPNDKKRMVKKSSSPPPPTAAPSHEPSKMTPLKHHKEPDTSSSSDHKIKDQKRDGFCETDKLVKQIEDLKRKNENLEKKLQSALKQLKTSRDNELSYKKRIESLERKLKENQQPQPHKPTKNKEDELHDSTKFIDAESIRKLTKIKEIGRGATSEVYKVSKTDEFALKIINSDVCAKTVTDDDTDDIDGSENDDQIDVDKIRRFFGEYEFISKMNHPNVIKTFGFCFGDRLSRPSILLEFCPFCLSKCVKKLSVSEKVRVVFEIAVAMKHIHSLGVIHRDLKPENILLDSEKHVKISDFGIATLVSLRTQTESMTRGVGTLKYMAPELLNESGKYTEKVDVYAFGVVAFFVLTNGDFPKISVIEIGNGKMAKIPESVNEISKNLIKKCWARVPDDRPSFDEIVELILKNNFGLINGINQSDIHLLEYE